MGKRTEILKDIDAIAADIAGALKGSEDLAVIPLVDDEVCGCTGAERCLGSFGSVRVDKYIEGEESYYFYDPTDLDEVYQTLKDVLNVDDDYIDAHTDSDLKRMYRGLPWVRAVCVNVDTP